MPRNESPPIVCGSDFSENAKQAATVAAILAARMGKPLVLVHVTDALDNPWLEQTNLVEPMRSLEGQLQAEAERLKAYGVLVETKLLAGESVERTIKDFGKKRGASLTVVSSVSKTDFSRWTLGSVSEYLAQVDPVPTLVVRDASPFEAWARGERALKVFVGTDFTPSSDPALHWVAALRRVGRVDVFAGYVDWPPYEAARLDTAEELKLGEDPPLMQGYIERDLHEKVTRILGENQVRVRALGSWGRPDLPLVEMAIEAEADLIVVGTHQRSGFGRLRHGSVSRGILRHASVSVASIPMPAVAPVERPQIRECLRVLVAVDLNAPHGFVASYGYSIVHPRGTVRLVHNLTPLSLSPPVITGYYEELPTPRERAQRIAEATAQLRVLAPRGAEARGVTTEVEITEKKETARAICAAAERFNADIVCIGVHTRPGALAQVLGSNSLAILQICRRPVLVVWPPSDDLP